MSTVCQITGAELSKSQERHQTIKNDLEKSVNIMALMIQALEKNDYISLVGLYEIITPRIHSVSWESKKILEGK